MNDAHIVDLYFRRDTDALQETDKKYGKYCFSIADNILSNREDAQECVNDTYLDAWNSIPPHRPRSLALFLGKITRRISIDRWRKAQAAKRGRGEMPLVLDELYDCIADCRDVEQELERKRLAQTMNSFVKGLPLAERNVFLCRYWYMDSVKAIARRFHYTEAKVKSMLYRTREKLRITLREEGFYET